VADLRNKVLPRESVELKGDLKEGPIIGSGPWIAEKFDPVNLITLVRNPDYFRKGIPYLDRLEFPRIPDEATRISAFRSKNLDTLSASVITSLDPEPYKREFPELVTTQSRSNGVGVEMLIRVDQPPLSEKRVRQAISKAIDRQQIIDTVWNGQGWLSVGFHLPDLSWAIPEAEMKLLWKRDVTSARTLLAEAGFAGGFDLDITVANYGTGFLSIGELVAAQLKESGINARLRVVEPAVRTQLLTTGEFGILISPSQPYATTNGELSGRWQSTSPNNILRVRNAALDDLINRQYSLRNEAERRKLVLDIQRLLIDEAFYFHIFTSSQLLMLWPYVKDYAPAGATDPARFTPVWIDK
jgi:peptide/nickel transport system substrate-binding protein